MKQQLVRDALGRINGLASDYWDTSEESYTDKKCKDVRFPNHNQYQESPVTVWNLNDKKN